MIKKNNNYYKNIFGFALVEVLVACSILSILTFSLISATNKGINLSNVALRQVQASFLLEEGAEAVKIIRDTSWAGVSPNTITLGTTYYLSFNNSTNVWSLSTTPNTVDSYFTRKVVFSAVSRDVNSQDIVSSGGTTDTKTEKVTVTVSWLSSGVTMTKTLQFYIADIFS